MAAPFTCTGDIYQVQSGQLRKFDASTSTYTDVGGANPSYNAIGYNVTDNYFYGVNNTDVVRIHSDGTMEIVFAGVSPIAFPGAGDVEGNTLWVKGGTNTVYGINLSTGAAQSVTMNASANISDFVIINNAGTNYAIGMAGSATTSRLFRINLSTGTVTSSVISGISAVNGQVGAMWTDSAGRVMGFYNLSGAVYEITDVFSTPVGTLAAQGAPSSINDGGSCPGAPFPNLQPIAQPDTFSTPFQTAVNGNVLSNNGGGVDSDPEGTALTVNTTPTVAPANGSVSIAANGAFTYTPNNGFYGTDTFQYQISDAFGKTDVATVTITVPAPPIDLVTVKTRISAAATPIIGDVVTFRIAVTNNGPADATGVSLTDLIPPGMTATANNGTVSAGTYNSTNGLWTIGALANGTTVTLTIEGTVNAGQGGNTITNSTTAAIGTQTDPTATGNDLTEAVTVAPLVTATPDSVSGVNGVAGASGVLNVFTGDTIGAAAASTSNATLSLASGSSVPAGLTFNTATGAIDVAPGTAANAYTFNYQICETANPTNCKTATATVTVAPTTDLKITKSNGTTTVYSGQTTTYTLTVTNNGPDSSTGAIVTDTPGTGITCPVGNTVTVSTGGSYTVANLTGAGIVLGTLTNGQSVTLSYSCTVN